ncbi:MAG: phage tail protein [Polyangiaceae bacterium]
MRSNLLRLGFALALLLPLAWLTATRGEAVAAVSKVRSYGGTVSLQLDGASVGTVRSAAGGDVVGSVIEHRDGADLRAKKQLGATAAEDIVLEVGLGLERSLYDWIAVSWTGKPARKSGALVVLDANLQARSAREFDNALISETTFPALDGASKEAGLLRVVLSPERVRTTTGSAAKSNVTSKSKAWLVSNFRLELDGLDCKRVAKIDSFTVKQTVATSAVGSARELSKEPGRLSFGDLKITLAEAGGDSWRTWHDDFVVRGNNADKNEKSGRIVLLGPDLKEELAEIKLGNAGIYALRATGGGGGGSSETIAQLEAELYVERMELSIKR